MEADRMNFDAVWQDDAQHLLPRQADFLDLSDVRPQGNKRTSKIFDSMAMLAMDRRIAVYEGYSMPKGTRWQVLAPRDEQQGKLRHVREWYQRKTAQLFQLRTMPYSGFDTRAHESWASLLAFGNQPPWIEVRRDQKGRPLGLFYRSEHTAGELEAAILPAHTIKSSGKIVGATGLSALVEALETRLRTGGGSTREQLLSIHAQMRTVFEKTLVAMDRYHQVG